MNSYPPELLAQLAPVMFVAGLDPPPPPVPATPLSPGEPDSQEAVLPARPQDPFTVLTLRLRDALLAQRKVAIWQAEKTKSFQTILVDKEVRFPPRKLVSPEDPQFSAAHSPLSPLTPTSPLYPDGLIAPIWIRKHTTLVPSVFVLFMRLYESPPHHPKSPLDAPDPEREREREQEERRRDAELAAEVALRKKSTNERGIKLTVVLIASRRMLDDAALDARLTFIRRSSGLDSRAALFVLSPVSQTELGDFVRSLQQALYEPALEYYTTHSKRVRRKRNRHSQAISTYPNPLTPLGTPAIARPLRPEGWTVRYEYKMACFAEFRGEDEVALKHYQDAYEMLVIMFGSTAILPPRTKRWAEAKVLADCIDIKISKLYLYNNEHSLALSHHNTHIRKFGDFSRGWGIGEETFEFWSWIARQHRILAELLEQGTRSTLTIPTHLPVVPSSVINNPANAASQILNPSAQRGSTSLEVEALRSLGINPSHALQHPGFYYYMAARCTEMRRERFLAAVDAEATQHALSSSPGFANEKKVNHLVIILELYTKAYELFKKYAPASSQNQSQGRLTLWIAYRIAETYQESGKFDMAVRFFERIAKTYRREQWGFMLRPLLSTWYACAQQLGDVELSVKLLIEMMGHDVEDSESPSSLEEDLLAVLKSTVPSSPDEALVVDLSESQSIFDSNVVFWTSEVKVNEPAAFQLSLTAPTNISIASLPISSLEIQFSEDVPPIVVRHVESENDEPRSVTKVDLGHIARSTTEEAREVEADLRWQVGATLVFAGTMSSEIPTSLKITQLLLTLTEGTWRIEVPFGSCTSRHGVAPVARWLCSLDPPRFIPIKHEEPSAVIVRHRRHNLHVSTSHQSPAYLNEDFPIVIDITNADDRELDITVDVLLQPSEAENAVNSIMLDDESSPSLIKGVRVGILAPGVSALKTLYLRNTGAGGDRMVDISVQSRYAASEDPSPENVELHDITETLQTLVVPTVDPINVKWGVVYRRSLGERTGPADLRTFEGDFWDDGDGGEAVVDLEMQCVGPWSLEVENIVLERQDNEHAKILYSSASDVDTDQDASVYLPGDELCEVCRISLAPSEPQEATLTPIDGPGEYRVKWRRLSPNCERGPTSTSTFRIPPLRPPRDELIALLDISPTATLHQPTPLTLTIRNQHASRTAHITVQLELDATDSFVVAGLRSGRIPILIPGSEEKLVWTLIPIECGYTKIPKIKVMDRRKAIASAQGIGGPDTEVEMQGEVVKIVDVRLEHRADLTALPGDEHPDRPDVEEGRGGIATVLVLP